ncbi:MAG: co-chaperone GroES family protein [Dehalococcoidales bacterium]|nr:co-chaperone GroES family protein [Dehalococcoidales bacterium]
MDINNFKPLKGHVAVRRDDPEAKRGEIIIPEAYRLRGSRGVVLAVGDEVECVKTGDKILFRKEYTVLPLPEREFAITEANTIFAVIKVDENNIERVYPINDYLMLSPDFNTAIKDGIEMTKKYQDKTLPAWHGVVIKTGANCRDVRPQDDVHYSTDGNAVCSEGGMNYIILKEENVLLKIN